MTALDSLMPTHSMLARAAAAPRGADCQSAVSPVADRQPPADPHIRKYLILRPAIESGSLQERAIIFDRDIQHSTMVPHDHRPVSAGFLILYGPGLLAVPEIGSLSLNLNPRPQDKAILSAFLNQA